MDALISLLRDAGAEALRSWGVFAICLMLLGVVCWLLWTRLRQREAEIEAERAKADKTIEALRSEVARLQELRLADAQRLIDVARNGTATMADRTAGDSRLQEMLLALVAGMARLGVVSPSPMLEASLQAPRSP